MHGEVETGRMGRRDLLKGVACGFGHLALSGLAPLAAASGGSRSPLSAQIPHHRQRAKRIIFLFMQGGPSQVDTFDYKEKLAQLDGKELPFRVARTRTVTKERVMKSPWAFRRYGESGRWVSELFPHVAHKVDDLCFIHSMHTEGVAHGPATLFLHTGATNLVRPSAGAWITYGLGTENSSLPGFVTLQPSMGNGGPRNYAPAFLPAYYQGTPIGRASQPVDEAGMRHLTNDRLDSGTRRRKLELVRRLNQSQVRAGGDESSALDAALQSYELAFRMEEAAPSVFNLSTETEATRKLYGLDEEATATFGRQCLQARRLCEAGVRFVQVNYADNGDNPRWDQHSNLKQHEIHARAVDKPIAGLLTDLKARGLLEDTLVWWGGEFGRNPFAEKKGTGRDHDPDGFTVWLAGGGVKAGHAHGETDEFGHRAMKDKVHMHDLHATVLHLLGLDHRRLTYRYAGRDFRLTDVYGRVVDEILA